MKRRIIRKIKNKVHPQKVFSRYFLLIVSLFTSAIIFNVILLPLGIVAGGINGLSVITKHVFNIDPSLFMIIIYGIFMVFSLILLGKKETSYAILSMIIYPLFVKLTANINLYLDINYKDPLILCLFYGIIGGVASGLIFRLGFNSGGISIISQILHKYYRISISKTQFWLNSIIVVMGGYLFGINHVMYAIIILYIDSLIIDRVLLGISRNKVLYLVTDKKEAIKNYIINDLKLGLTILDKEGNDKQDHKDAMMVVTSTSDYFKVTEGIKIIDPEIFFVVTDAYQVGGGQVRHKFPNI